FGAWLLARVSWRVPELSRAYPPPSSPWFRDRSSLPPVPPTSPPLANSPIVILATIDSVRADVLASGDDDAALPLLADMKRSGASFTGRTAPGSQTAVPLTAVFSGRYFSQLYWSYHGSGSTRFVYAGDDPTERFPAILTARGVKTASFCSVNFLANDFGVLRGFGEERVISQGRRHAFAREMIDPVIDRLRAAGSEPLFL